MASIPAAMQDLFEKKTYGHLATVFPDGSPHVTPVWVDYDSQANRVLVNTERGRQKEKNVRQNPSVGISMTDPDDPYRYLSITGEVEALKEKGAREHIDELSQRYMGKPYPNPIETRRVIMTIRPESIR